MFHINRQPTKIYSSFTKSAQISKQIKSIKIQKCNPLWILVGSTSCIGFKYFFNGNNIVYCEDTKIKKALDDNFDWNKFLSYLSPELLNLLAAIIVSIFLFFIYSYLLIQIILYLYNMEYNKKLNN